MTPTERLNSGVIRHLYKGYSNADATPEQRLAAVLAPLAADTKYVEHAPPQRMKWGGTHLGVEGWQSFLAAVSAELEHEEFVCESLVAHGPGSSPGAASRPDAAGPAGARARNGSIASACGAARSSSATSSTTRWARRSISAGSDAARPDLL